MNTDAHMVSICTNIHVFTNVDNDVDYSMAFINNLNQ